MNTIGWIIIVVTLGALLAVATALAVHFNAQRASLTKELSTRLQVVSSLQQQLDRENQTITTDSATIDVLHGTISTLQAQSGTPGTAGGPTPVVTPPTGTPVTTVHGFNKNVAMAMITTTAEIGGGTVSTFKYNNDRSCSIDASVVIFHPVSGANTWTGTLVNAVWYTSGTATAFVYKSIPEQSTMLVQNTQTDLAGFKDTDGAQVKANETTVVLKTDGTLTWTNANGKSVSRTLTQAYLSLQVRPQSPNFILWPAITFTT